MYNSNNSALKSPSQAVRLLTFDISIFIAN